MDRPVSAISRSLHAILLERSRCQSPAESSHLSTTIAWATCAARRPQIKCRAVSSIAAKALVTHKLSALAPPVSIGTDRIRSAPVAALLFRPRPGAATRRAARRAVPADSSPIEPRLGGRSGDCSTWRAINGRPPPPWPPQRQPGAAAETAAAPVSTGRAATSRRACYQLGGRRRRGAGSAAASAINLPARQLARLERLENVAKPLRASYVYLTAARR